MTRSLVSDQDIDEAAMRLDGHVIRTPLIPSPASSRRIDADVVLKPEPFQPTNSFKVRGPSTGR